MARELIRKTWCDVHLHRDDERVEAEAIPLSASLAVDLCEVCQKEVEPVFDLIIEHGYNPRVEQEPSPRQRSKPRRPSDGGGGRRPCLWCTEDYSNSTAWWYHVQTVHNIPKTSVGELIDNQCPLCSFTGKKGTTGTGVATHLSTKHDGLSIQEALMEAHKQGDPHGVYARVFDQGT